ncbi:trihelix transcription factor GTL1 [Prunus yedoensis var. nudiflora]|uniref:Trihelix transcription factor GTL1 n=1 Tax=Prunus yedoensis var. nudiflora TaxID=2094558 RepID=A0A315AAP8_PRUYE|nr:trihelix transcription factor GTL1 [Prunus yedoensis var. nudiflora]
MEPLTADRLIPNPAAFPEQIAPFPERTDHHLLFANPTAVVHSPPQKLRPIRCSSGRCPAIELPDSAGNLGDGGRAHVGSGTWGDEGKTSPDCRVFEPLSLSSSPDVDGDEYLKAEGTVRMKRKRKRRSRMGGRLERVEIFLESLVMKVMEKQEQMHKQLIEMIEKREKERIAREEDWKQQELDRMKRDEEIRAQETSHNGIQRDTMVMLKCDQTNRRWPEAEVQSLITLRAALEHKFRIAGNSKGPVWEEISLGMYDMGYNRSARKCKEKWENINKYFKRSMGTDKKRSANAKTCPYFH